MKFKIIVNYICRVKNYQYSANQLIVLTCLYIALICNLPFLIKTKAAITVASEYDLVFLYSVPLLLTCIFIIINGIIGINAILKPVLISSVLLSSSLFYATTTYGIVFDFNMIQNGLETDTAEALSYLNLYAVLFFLITGVLPASLLYFARMKQQTVVKSIVSRIGLIAVNVSLVLLIANFFYADYASVGRNNRVLSGYITPYKFIDASVKYAKLNHFSTPLPFKTIDNTPQLLSDNNVPKVTIIVVGETARAQNFSLNGYASNTNRFTQDKGVISFSEVSSCGTATAVSLPCMFSRLDRVNYNNRNANAQQNVLDIASMAGIDVLWIDNNNGSCKGVCERINTIEIETTDTNPLCDGEYCLDEALLEPLQHKLDNLGSNSTLIVLHMMGSHGPTYYKRYPKDKRHFLPDCQRSDIQHCSENEIINTYDNTIAYTDFVLSEIIGKLENLESTSSVQTSMLYISDHGESLGEKGVYLHGLPYMFAPREQTHVPMLYWQNQIADEQSFDCINSVSSTTISHDNLFDIVLGISSVKSSQYNEQRDVLADCRTVNAMLATSDVTDDITNNINGAK
jgi:lipid A ethanolaminephosphotransferase